MKVEKKFCMIVINCTKINDKNVNDTKCYLTDTFFFLFCFTSVATIYIRVGTWIGFVVMMEFVVGKLL